MNDPLERRLQLLVPEPGHDEIDAALRSVLRRSRRQRRTLAAVGIAAATTTVVGAVALVDRAHEGDGPGDPDVAMSPSTDGQPSGPSDGWPWTTSTTAPTPPLSEADRARVRAEVLDRTDDPDAQPYFRSCCGDDGPDAPVGIELRADAVELAQELHERWGAAVEIAVGGRVFPTGEPSGNAIENCRAIPPGDGIPGLEGTLELEDEGRVPSGGDVVGSVVLHNRTDHDIVVDRPKWGDVVFPRAGEVAGVTTQAFTLEGRSAAVPAGGTLEIEGIVFGTTTCGLDGPPGIAPGSYEAAVTIARTAEEAPVDRAELVVRAPLVVTPLVVE
jgi:hypothetical protein